jgi:TRAP-type mannitol/chloroaromatic compound transport system permease large subunit
VFALVGGLVGSSSDLGLPHAVKEYGIEAIAALAGLYALYLGFRSREFRITAPRKPRAARRNQRRDRLSSPCCKRPTRRRLRRALRCSLRIIFAFLVSVGDRYRGLAGVIGAIAAHGRHVLWLYQPSAAGRDRIARRRSSRCFAFGCGAGNAGAASFFAISLLLGAVPFLREPLLSEMSRQVTAVMVPPLALIFLVLGTIFIGLATPTEGGAMGAAGAVCSRSSRRRLNFDLVKQATESTAKLSAFVLFILLGARVFSLTFYGVDGHKWVEELLVSLPGGQIGFLLFINALVFVLAFFLDFFELAFIIVPLLGPAAESIGIDLIWFGVILAVNMQTSFMHPPFGFALFYLRSVAPKEPYVDKVSGQLTAGVTTGQIYWGAVPFVVIQCIMVVLVIMFPQMVMHYKGAGTGIDPSKVKIEIQMPDDTARPA